MKLRRYNVQLGDFGNVPVMRPIDSGWGELSPLKGTEWERFVPVVSAKAWSMALQKYSPPLLAEIGPPPRAYLLKFPATYRKCRDKCVMFKATVCHPNPKVPACYVPEVEDPQVRRLVATLVQAWAEERYVVVVEGEEFVVG